MNLGFRGGIPEPDFQHASISLARTATLASADGVTTLVPWQALTWNVGGFIWSLGAPTRIYLPAAGLYHVEGYINWANAAIGIRETTVRLSGVDVGIRLQEGTAWSFDHAVVVEAEFMARAGQHIELAVRQTRTGSVNLQVVNGAPYIVVQRIGATP